jgi:CRISPR-associated protein Csd2
LSLAELEETEKKVKKIKEKKKKADMENPKLLSPAAKSVILELFIDSKEKRAAQWMCKNFFDVRTFGAVMSTGGLRCGQIRGPVQLGFAESIEPIVTKDVSMSRTAAVSVDDPKQKGLGAGKSIVPYGLYRVHGYISAHLAGQTGFSEDDLTMLWEALQNMFDHDPAAARTGMNAQKLFVFKHDSKLGNAPAHKLFDLIEVKRKNGSEEPARSFSDYDVTVGTRPDGVELIEKL